MRRLLFQSWIKALAIAAFTFIVMYERGIAEAHAAKSNATKRVGAYVIRINVQHPQLTLYKSGAKIQSFPVALGTDRNATPIGQWVIVDKQKNWGKGFGTRWMGLNVPWGTYGIHGTNRPDSIGQFASHGCIRMQNADVEKLYDLVDIGTKVVIEGNPLAHPRLLEHGNIGADVREVQKALKSQSFYKGSLDGKFDSEMQIALLYFQLAHHLPMNGEVSMDDYQALGLLNGNSVT